MLKPIANVITPHHIYNDNDTEERYGRITFIKFKERGNFKQKTKQLQLIIKLLCVGVHANIIIVVILDVNTISRDLIGICSLQMVKG